jgi:hypothetical protein
MPSSYDVSIIASLPERFQNIGGNADTGGLLGRFAQAAERRVRVRATIVRLPVAEG